MSKRRLTLTLISILLMVITLLSITSCTAAGLQVNERAFVQMLGLYKSENLCHVSMQLLDNETVSGEGVSILGAVANAELKQGKKLFLGQMKLFVLGDGMPGCSELSDISEELNVFLSGDICPACPVIYAEDPAAVVDSGVPAEEILAKLSVFSSQGKSVLTPLTEIAAKSVGHFSSAVLPVAVKTDETVDFGGLRFIDKLGVFGEMSDRNALGVKFLTGGLDSADTVTFSGKIGTDSVSSEILGGKSRYRVTVQDGILVYHVKVKIKINVTEKPVDMDDRVVIEATEVYVMSMIHETYAAAVWGYGTDAFSIEKLVRKQLPDFYDEYKRKPVLTLQNSRIEIEVTSK